MSQAPSHHLPGSLSAEGDLRHAEPRHAGPRQAEPRQAGPRQAGPAPELPWLALGWGLSACLLYLGSELFVFGRLAFPLDDSWIHLQFARQLAEGHGLTYNGDHWVPGSTAPLWTALLSIAFLLPINPLVWAKVLGIASFLGALVALDRLAVELQLERSLRHVATLCVASCSWLIWSALSGMEICLFLCVSTWGLLWHLQERASVSLDTDDAPRLPRSLWLFAASCLLRPEGMLLMVLALLDRSLVWRSAPNDQGLALRLNTLKQRGWVQGSVLLALLLLPSMLFNWVSSGSLFATTLAVKGGGGSLLPDAGHLSKVITVLFTSQPTLLLFAGAGLVVLVQRLGQTADHGLLLGFWVLGLPLANAVLSPRALGNFGRYYFPLLPLVALLGALGLNSVWRNLGRWLHIGRFRFPLRMALVLLLLTPLAWGALQGSSRYLQTLGNVEDSDVQAARWLAPRLPSQAVLAVQDIGALKFLLPNPVIDLAGIVTPEVQPILAAGRGQGETYWERQLYDYLAQRQPDYLVVFPTSYPMLTQGVEGFQEVRRFTVERNVTMAGAELVIYSTPWTRHPLRQVAETES